MGVMLLDCNDEEKTWFRCSTQACASRRRLALPQSIHLEGPGASATRCSCSVSPRLRLRQRAGSQAPPPAPPQVSGTPPAQAAPDPRLTEAVADGVTLTYANRPITVLRARVLTQMPADRARAAITTLDTLVDDKQVGAVSVHAVGQLLFVRVGSRDVLSLVPADLDPTMGETLPEKAEAAAASLRLALDESIELRTPARLARSIGLMLVATILLLALMLLVWQAHRRIHALLVRATERSLGRVLPTRAAMIQTALLSKFLGGIVTLLTLGLSTLLVYWWLTFSLRQFPYSRPLGESLRARLLALLGPLADSAVQALPGLLTVLVILVIARAIVNASNSLFESVEQGNIEVPWAFPETAGATRRIAAVMVWLFAVVVAYPYVPGSGSDAFKGVSVFVGLVISLGSSGIVNQLMSGLTLTYSRSLKVGDFVRIAENEGTVTDMNLLSVKLRTFQGEEVTVPNAVVVGQSTTNYTKLAPAGATYLPTIVTIGYDTPWRQVHALLMLAASRTPNVRADPAPRVVQEALEDFYVRYRLLVCLENPNDRLATRDRLNAQIQDAFNEFGYRSCRRTTSAIPRRRKWSGRHIGTMRRRRPHVRPNRRAEAGRTAEGPPGRSALGDACRCAEGEAFPLRRDLQAIGRLGPGRDVGTAGDTDV